MSGQGAADRTLLSGGGEWREPRASVGTAIPEDLLLQVGAR